MGTVYNELDQSLTDFIRAQHMFFVATAPLDGSGHVNLSPKGLDSFRILDPKTFAYVDFTGSGVETISHIRENGRIVVMFCAFDGSPKILRLYGRGEVVEPTASKFAHLANAFPDFEGVRAIIVVTLERIADSCGYAVPRYRYQGERSQLPAWTKKQGSDGLVQYRARHNRTSIDGLPGLDDIGDRRRA